MQGFSWVPKAASLFSAAAVASAMIVPPGPIALGVSWFGNRRGHYDFVRGQIRNLAGDVWD